MYSKSWKTVSWNMSAWRKPYHYGVMMATLSLNYVFCDFLCRNCKYCYFPNGNFSYTQRNQVTDLHRVVRLAFSVTASCSVFNMTMYTMCWLLDGADCQVNTVLNVSKYTTKH